MRNTKSPRLIPNDQQSRPSDPPVQCVVESPLARAQPHEEHLTKDEIRIELIKSLDRLCFSVLMSQALKNQRLNAYRP